MNHPNKWTPDELNILTQIGAEHSALELSEKFLSRHSPSGIAGRRQRLGIRCTKGCISAINRSIRSRLNLDKLCKVDQTLLFDDIDYVCAQILLGSMLGDGCVSRTTPCRNFKFVCGHVGKQIPYTHWKAKNMQMFLARSSDNGNISEMCTCTHPIFTRLRDEFYPVRTACNKYRIPTTVARKMDEFGLLIWYLDDGCASKRDPLQMLITANGWNITDLTLTIQMLNSALGLHMYIKEYPRHGSVHSNKSVKIPAVDRDILIPKWNSLFNAYSIPTCMKYKFGSLA